MKLVNKLFGIAIISTVLVALIIIIVQTFIYAGTIWFIFKMITTPDF